MSEHTLRLIPCNVLITERCEERGLSSCKHLGESGLTGGGRRNTLSMESKSNHAMTRGWNGAQSKIRHIFTHCFHKHVIIIHCGYQGEGIMSEIYSPIGKSSRYSSISSNAVVQKVLEIGFNSWMRIRGCAAMQAGWNLPGNLNPHPAKPRFIPHTLSTRGRTQEWTLPFMNHNHNNGI